MAEARKRPILCSICHDNDNGATFAKELKRRLQELHPGAVVRDEWHGIGEDDFDVLEKAINDSKFIVFVFNKDDIPTSTKKISTWFLDCWKQADKCLGSRDDGLKPIFVMIKPFCKKNLPPHISNVHTPIWFQENYLMDTERWNELLNVFKVGNDEDANDHTVQIRQEVELTLTDKWRKFIGKMYETLVEGLDPVNYINGLLSKVITFAQKDEIEALTTKRRQNEAILNIVVRHKEDNIKNFIRCLKTNERSRHGDLYQKMSEELKRDYDGLPPLAKPVTAPAAATEVTEPTEPSQQPVPTTVANPVDSNNQRLPYSRQFSGGDGDAKEHKGEFSLDVTDAKAEAVPDTALDAAPDTLPGAVLDTVLNTILETMPNVKAGAVPERCGSTPLELENQKICSSASCGHSMPSNNKHCPECGTKYEPASPAASAEKAISGIRGNWMWLVPAVVIGVIAITRK